MKFVYRTIMSYPGALSQHESHINEADDYLLQCVKNMPNLYDINHKDYDDDDMRFASWGVIAQNSAMTRLEAIQRWSLLLEQYYEEKNLLRAESDFDDGNVLRENDSRFPHFKVMQDILDTHNTNSSNRNNTGKKEVRKRKVQSASTVAIKRAKVVHKQVGKKLSNLMLSAPASTNPNPNIFAGKIVFNELQKCSPNTAKLKRQLICGRIFACNVRLSEE